MRDPDPDGYGFQFALVTLGAILIWVGILGIAMWVR